MTKSAAINGPEKNSNGGGGWDILAWSSKGNAGVCAFAWIAVVIVCVLILAPSASAQPVVSFRTQAKNIGSIESASSSSTPKTSTAPASHTVTFHGHFIDTHAPVPPGDSAPSGTILTYRTKGDLVYESLGGQEASKWPASAKAASRRRMKAHAAAVWPCHLGGEEKEHCYAISRWAMGAGESVEGAEAIVDTEQVDVYEWESGAFVTNEIWESWDSGPEQWSEAGQIAGEYESCCTIHPFVAWKVAGGNFESIKNTGLTYTTNQYYQYQISGQSADGHWCLYIGSSQVACPYFGPSYPRSTLLEDGMEVGANSWQANNGVNQVNGWWGGARQHWNFDSLIRQTDTCVLRPSGAPWPGDVQYATCEEP